MRVIKKIFLWLLVLVVIGAAVIIGWFYFGPSYNHDPYKLIPQDAVYIIETNNLSEAWKRISASKTWNHLRTNEYFSSINKSASTLDSLIKSNSVINKMLSDRQLVISAHMTSAKDYDFLFIVDMGRGARVSVLKDYINSLLGIFSYSITTRKFMDTEISELHSLKSKDILSMSFIDNLLVASYNGKILEASISEKNKKVNNGIISNKKFLEVDSKISNKKMFSIKFSYAVIDKFMNYYLSEPSDMVNSLSKSLGFTTLNMDLEEERLSFKGYTNVIDTVPSYFKALLGVRPGKMGAYEIIPQDAALYVSITFADFDEFYSKMSSEYSRQDKDYENYDKKIKQLEKYLRIDLKKDFFSWIGSEVAFIMMKPSGTATNKEAIVALHAKNIDEAKSGLDHLTRQVRRKLPVKFETVNHLNHEINLLNIKGLFKILFGKLFEKIEKPYFTIIEDYVVFSNSPEALMSFIEQYTKGKILSQDSRFMNFKDNFDAKGNVTAFVLMPQMYSWIYYYSGTDTKNSVKKNRDYITSFRRIGFQLVSDSKLFDTRIIADYEGNTSDLESLENIKTLENSLLCKQIEDMKIKPDLTAEQLKEDGDFKTKFQNGNIQYEYSATGGKLNGTCKIYFENGKLQSQVVYKEGKADGVATFYYENGNVKAEVKLENDQIIDQYKELYEDGKTKAVLEYSNGKMDGDAQYFYSSGNLKMEGRYSNGLKDGIWRFHTESGDIYQRKHFKDGEEKK